MEAVVLVCLFILRRLGDRLKTISADFLRSRIARWLLFVVSVVLLCPRESLAEHRRKILHAINKNAPAIREITVEIRDVFDEPDPGLLYRAANNLKISTREEVVRRELLFKTGDPYDEFLVQESERNLRSLPFFRQVSIVPKFEDSFVDLTVRVQDTWTLYPQFTFSSGSGSSRRSTSIVDSDILGFGKRLELNSSHDAGRSGVAAIWDDRRFWGTQQQLFGAYIDRSDGYRYLGAFGKPYRNLVDRYAWSLGTDRSDTVGKLYSAGTEKFIFHQNKEFYSGYLSAATGEAETRVRRYSAGWDYSNERFRQASAEDFKNVDVDPQDVSHDPSLLAENRKFSGPSFAAEQIQQDFITLNYIDRFERVQDFNLGTELRVKTTLAASSFGSSENAALVSASGQRGVRFEKEEFLRGQVSVSSRAEDGGFENSVIGGELRYYDVWGPAFIDGMYIGRHTLAGNLLVDYGSGLDRDRQFLLGATTGLRGYKDRTFAGERLVLLNLEDRMHFAEDIFHLVSIGSAVFCDVGTAGDQSLGQLIGDEIRSDIGFGLRIGFPRAAGGGVFRIDMAFPLRSGPDGTKSFEPRLLLTTGQMFTGLFSGEVAGADRINSRAGLNQ